LSELFLAGAWALAAAVMIGVNNAILKNNAK
jgi:hypothetical protein